VAHSAHLRILGTVLIAVSLCAQRETGTLIGKVVDVAGAPAASADIRLQRSGFGERYAGVADSAGKFEMRGLPSGDYNLVVSLNGLFNKIEELHVVSARPVDLGVIHLVLAPCNEPGKSVCDEVEAAKATTPLSQSSTEIPVLTVCEILHDVGRYDGKSVIVVGRSVGTMEGSWLDEECAPRMFVNGRFWKPNISTAYVASWFTPPPPKPSGFKWDRRAIQAKVEIVRKTTNLRGYEDKSSDHWLAVFGRLEAGLPHQIALGEGRTGLADGFGHLNGSPAQLISPRDGFLQLKAR
jgi:hypothetical protein